MAAFFFIPISILKMKSSYLIYLFTSCFVLYSSYGGWRLCKAATPRFSKTITVSLHGGGDFTSIRQAILKGVPKENSEWIYILIRQGEYREQVEIPANKPYIVMQGENNPIISYSSGGNITDATLIVLADNFVAKGLTFKNTYNLALIRHLNNENPTKQAVAAFVDGDKASFYGCRFESVQDTLWDSIGRHFFKDCYIQGVADFIMGNGQSVYENCKINVTAENSLAYITAQSRTSASESTGFVFKNCNVFGSGVVYLGRPWGPYSRVIYYQTQLSDSVAPEGWSAWNHKGNEKYFTYAEVDCTGPGSDTSKRVKWIKKLSSDERNYFLSSSFNNADGWIGSQP